MCGHTSGLYITWLHKDEIMILVVKIIQSDFDKHLKEWTQKFLVLVHYVEEFEFNWFVIKCYIDAFNQIKKFCTFF